MTLSGTPDPTPVDAVELVNGQFESAQEFVDVAYSDLTEAINELANYDPGYTRHTAAQFALDLDNFSGNYAFPEIPSPPDLVSDFPDAPLRPDLGKVPEVVIPETPDSDIPIFTDQFNYSQTRYIRDGLNAYRARLVDFIDNGGTGIAANIEQAIYDRDKARQELTDEQRYLEIQNTSESRGNSRVSGAHNAAMNAASKERARMYEEISRSVMIKAAELEQENMRIAQDSLSKTDSILTALHGSEEQRDLDAESTRINSTIAIYEAYIRGVIARLEAHKVTVDSVVAFISANVEVIRANATVYGADVTAYTAEVDAQAKQLTSTAAVYAANVSGIEAAIRGIGALADVDISLYKVESDVATTNSQNAIAASRLNLESQMKRIDTRIESMKAVAAVSAQIVASALNSTTTSASIGQSTSSSFGHSYDEVKAIDAGETTSNVHSWDETA